MAMVFKYGLMVQNIKVIGKITEHMVKDAFNMQMVINLKETLLMINLMVLVFIPVKMVQFILVCGLMMFSMDKDKHNGLTDLHLLVGTKMVRRMVLVVILGLKVINIKVNGKII